MIPWTRCDGRIIVRSTLEPLGSYVIDTVVSLGILQNQDIAAEIEGVSRLNVNGGTMHSTQRLAGEMRSIKEAIASGAAVLSGSTPTSNPAQNVGSRHF